MPDKVLPSRRSPLIKRKLAGTLLSWTLVLLTPLFVMAFMQNSLLYYPEKVSMDALLANVRSSGLSAWPSQGDFRGLVAEPVNASLPTRGTIIIFHGNAGHAGHRNFYVPELTGLGLRVILAEYPGYGARGGKLGEDSLVADAVEIVRLARAQFDGPVLLLGESLGAAVAAAVCRESGEMLSGVLLATPWDTLKRIASHHYPWLPVSLVLRDRYDSVRNLAGYSGRVSVVLAELDQIVPAQFGRALFDSVSTTKQVSVLAGVDHNDWFDRADTKWWAAQIDFLLPRP